MPSLFSISIRTLKGIGERRAALFARLGVQTVGALLRFYPRAYQDWSNPQYIADVPQDADGVVCATVTRAPTEHRIRKGMTLYKLTAADDSGTVQITLFNNKYGAELLKTGEAFLFRGKLSGTGSRRTMSAPDFVAAAQGQRIRPIYPQTEGLPSRVIEAAVRQALLQLPETVRDPLPQALRTQRELCDLRTAIQNIHEPSSQGALAQARRRLAYEELLVLQLGLLQHKARTHTETALRAERDCSDRFFVLLPFEPTAAQRRAVHEATQDMMSNRPMSRLLQGDVGSGKTAVAAALCYTAAQNGLQTALMAPTEILATQHAQTFAKLFEGTGVHCALLTGSCTAAQKREICAQLADGTLQAVVGTHALLSENVRFDRLGLVITDEQHRFGVAQRAALAAKGAHPHLLVMSATPIPRTLALILYGDLDVSILDELPPGRLPVDTIAVGSNRRAKAFEFIRKQLDNGRQAYVVCSLVENDEESVADPRKAATEYCAELRNGELRNYSVGLLHGRMKAAEKEAVMAAFALGQVQVLVATTVIEVGVDVPNASVMLIENAERFGLSQLHQLRGRVGRGGTQSYCILVSDAKNPDTRRRLEVMTETTDGFRIADEDLKLRGPGDFFGARQHGLPTLQVADLCADMTLLNQAQSDAARLLSENATLENDALRGLGAEVRRLFGRMGEQSLN